MVYNVETTVGISIFFDESLSESQIHAIGDEIGRGRSERNAVYLQGRGLGDLL